MNQGEFSDGQAQQSPNVGDFSDAQSQPSVQSDATFTGYQPQSATGSTIGSNNPFDAPQATISSSDEVDSSPSTSQFISSRSRRRRFGNNAARREEIAYSAANHIASDPNTPGFFSEAIMQSTPNPTAKKSKKGLFIGLGLGAIALIAVVGIATAVIPAHIKTAPINLEAALNNYMALLAYNDVTHDTSEISKLKASEFAFTRESRRASGNSEYAEKLTNSLDAIIEKLKTRELKDDSSILGSASGLLKRVKQYFAITNKVYSDEILKDFNQYGAEHIVKDVQSRDTLFDDSNFDSVIYDEMAKYVYSVLERYEIYKKYDCIIDGDIDSNCLAQIPSEEYDSMQYGARSVEAMLDDIETLEAIIIDESRSISNIIGELKDE